MFTYLKWSNTIASLSKLPSAFVSAQPFVNLPSISSCLLYQLHTFPSPLNSLFLNPVSPLSPWPLSVHVPPQSRIQVCLPGAGGRRRHGPSRWCGCRLRWTWSTLCSARSRRWNRASRELLGAHHMELYTHREGQSQTCHILQCCVLQGYCKEKYIHSMYKQYRMRGSVVRLNLYIDWRFIS